MMSIKTKAADCLCFFAKLKNQTNIQMGKRRLTTIHPRAKLPGATNFGHETKKVMPDIFGYAFSRNISFEYVPIVILICRRALVLKELAQLSTTPLEGRGNTSKRFKNKGLEADGEEDRKQTKNLTNNIIFPMST